LENSVFFGREGRPNDLVRAAFKEEHTIHRETCVMDDDVMSNVAYYRSREQAERALANQAPAADIGKIHLQLAERYAALAAEIEAQLHTGPPLPA
jgi:hypothetical protein